MIQMILFSQHKCRPNGGRVNADHNAHDQTEWGDHTGDTFVLRVHRLRRVHHRERRKPATGETVQNDQQHENEIVCNKYRIFSFLRLVIAEQKGRNECEPHQDGHPEHLAWYFGQVLAAVVTDHGEQIEEQKTGERHKVVVRYEVAGLFHGAEYTRKHRKTHEEYQKSVQAHRPDRSQTFEYFASVYRLRFTVGIGQTEIVLGELLRFVVHIEWLKEETV